MRSNKTYLALLVLAFFLNSCGNIKELYKNVVGGGSGSGAKVASDGSSMVLVRTSGGPHAPKSNPVESLAYDATGNLSLYQNNQTGEVSTYTYDVNLRIKSKTTASNTTSFYYDADGNKVGTVFPDGKSIAYLTGSVRMVKNPGDTPKARRMYGDTEIDENGHTRTFIRDHLGSVVSVIDERNMASQKHALPYGQDWYRWESADTKTDYGFNGQIEESGLLDYSARHMRGGAGVFHQPDTVIPDANRPLGYHRYAYVNNNPVRYIDPSGHEAEDESGGDDEVRQNEEFKAYGGAEQYMNSLALASAAPDATFHDPANAGGGVDMQIPFALGYSGYQDYNWFKGTASEPISWFLGSTFNLANGFGGFLMESTAVGTSYIASGTDAVLGKGAFETLSIGAALAGATPGALNDLNMIGQALRYESQTMSRLKTIAADVEAIARNKTEPTCPMAAALNDLKIEKIGFDKIIARYKSQTPGEAGHAVTLVSAPHYFTERAYALSWGRVISKEAFENQLKTMGLDPTPYRYLTVRELIHEYISKYERVSLPRP